MWVARLLIAAINGIWHSSGHACAHMPPIPPISRLPNLCRSLGGGLAVLFNGYRLAAATESDVAVALAAAQRRRQAGELNEAELEAEDEGEDEMRRRQRRQH